MRIKILLLRDNPALSEADVQLLRNRGMLVYTTFDPQLINELTNEIRPDLIFFNAHHSSNEVTNAYNNIVNGIQFTNIPVVFTLSEDDVYLITRKRTESKNTRTMIADNMIDAIKMAFSSTKTYYKNPKKISNPNGGSPNKNLKGKTPGAQLQIPFC